MDITEQQQINEPKYYETDEDDFLDESIKKENEKSKKRYERRLYCYHNNICYYCDKTYSTRSSLKRHTGICKKLEQLIHDKLDQKAEKNKMIEEKNKMLLKQLETSKTIIDKLEKLLSTKEVYYEKRIKLLEDNIDKLVLQNS